MHFSQGGNTMLYIKIGRPKGDCIIDVTHYFNYKKKKEWFADSFVKKVIKEIDNCEAIKDEYIETTKRLLKGEYGVESRLIDFLLDARL